MVVFDSNGNFLDSWGEGTFPHAHGLHIDANDFLYCTDDRGHFVRKCTTEGKVLLEIGIPGESSAYMSGLPFHRCTHTALSPDGDIYVTDGYGNARIHKYSPDGKLLLSWGEPGTDPGQFNIPHNIVTDEEGWVYVADRENHRVQVFDRNGKYETQWNNMHRPCGLYCCGGHKPRFLIGELGPMGSGAVNRHHANIGPRLSIVDREGKVIARLGGEAGPGLEPGKFIAPHGLAVDKRGDIYVGEVSYAEYPRFWDTPIPWRMRSLQKLQKVQ
jgi:DNA-binding beta-propeller fold protein YncE